MPVRSPLLTYETSNAVLGWIVLGLLLFAVVERALTSDFLWAGVGLAIIAIGLIPVVISRHPTEMIAWEVLAMAAIPLVARTLGILVGAIGYLAVAALALVVAVELDAFTSVEMTPGFAVAFVVIMTMAVAGLWTIASYLSDVYLGTSFLVSQDALMWDLITATIIGVAAGVVFELYFRRLSPSHRIIHEHWGTSR